MHSLVRAFAAMIDQKLKVINMLSARARPAAELYTSTSPIHGASVGMHLRHSLDHCTRLADAVTTLSSVPGMEPTPTLRYDVRERGTGAELDPTLAAAPSTLIYDRRQQAHPGALQQA
ncbi:hypothetical protein CTAYLR_002238 [Chrysophaeum taylorii]|uniref:Uncharacterized protein n=1 Tax=Chrysophaeum taylorii TaxID=2483200 RepID=A0AAD7XU53_9STRA|nr:hypothetical protein CTAYLR_002238 [Chrysophaeum taylorii]